MQYLHFRILKFPLNIWAHRLAAPQMTTKTSTATTTTATVTTPTATPTATAMRMMPLIPRGGSEALLMEVFGLFFSHWKSGPDRDLGLGAGVINTYLSGCFFSPTNGGHHSMMSPFSSPTAKEGSPKWFFPGDAPLKSDSNRANCWIYGGYIVVIHSHHRGSSQTQTLITTDYKLQNVGLP